MPRSTTTQDSRRSSKVIYALAMSSSWSRSTFSTESTVPCIRFTLHLVTIAHLQEIAQCMHLLARLAYILNDSQEAQAHQLKAVQMCERCSGIDAAVTIHEYATLAHYAFSNLQVLTSFRLYLTCR